MTAEAFKNEILALFFQDVHRLEQDNYPKERPINDGVDRSQMFDVGKHLTYLNWLFASYDDLFKAFAGLANDESRQVFINLIRYRLSGHLHVRIDGKWKALKDEAARFQEAFAPQPSALAVSGRFGDLRRYGSEWNGVRYDVDTVNNGLRFLLVYRQYFYNTGGVCIQPEPGDHVIDGGAYTGDTACVFSRTVGPEGRVYSFDPVQNHLEIVAANIARPGHENVRVFPYGLSDCTIKAPPIRLDGYNPAFRIDGQPVPVCRIDDFVMDGRIERVDFIKMDIEGSELAALHGCIATIKHFRPKLAISAYHKPNDLFELQNYLQAELAPLGYRFYLDHYTYWDAETVLYAIADK